MSYVGEPFDHDVFVSYAHAERETDETLIRNWSQRIAIHLRGLLASALNPTVEDGSRFDMFLDDRSLRAGDDLTAKLRAKAERSAILLVLMSPLYPRKSWCRDELNWFLDQAAKDGRNRDLCVPLRIQPLLDTGWPDRLRDERGALPVYLDLADTETGLPLGLDDPNDASLKDLLRKTQIQVKGKLEELRRRLEARRAYERVTQATLDRPMIYLHAQPEDKEVWDRITAELDEFAVVCPEELPAPATDDALLQRQREARLKELQECAALLLLRARNSETFRYELMAFYTDLQRLYQSKQRRLPWAILDRVGGPLPLADRFRVPKLSVDNAAWQTHLIAMIRPSGGLL